VRKKPRSGKRLVSTRKRIAQLRLAKPAGPTKRISPTAAAAPKLVHDPEAESTRDASTYVASFPIVGIGASAGGLEAFTQLLSELPPDTGMGFVVVQHLAPKYESMLTELLSNTTTLPVTEVTEGMRVERDHVYVIPPNTTMGIREGVLHLVPRTEVRGQHMPIDMFLRSLAEDQKSHAIGVILSGTASDGTIGLKAIKAEGGITLAQEPKTARYDGMPRAAIASGAVDFVLPIESIGHELVNVGRHPYLARTSSPDLSDERTDGDGPLNRVFFLLRSVTGTDFTHYKHATIRRRIRRRMVLQRTERLPDYIEFLQKNPAEIENLYQDILIHVTGFFRDPETFEALKDDVFPRVLSERPKGSPVRVWVPGCSTGEEAYSLAIALLEAVDAEVKPSVQIFATDLSLLAVDRARAGFYSESSVADVSPDRLRRFFSRADGGYRISKSIRDMCVFAKQDVTKDPPFSKLDLISCRNVLIYLGPSLQKRVLSVFHYALNPTGVLVLGTSETIGSFADWFTLVDKRHKLYVRKSMVARPKLDFQPDPVLEHDRPGARLASAGQDDMQGDIDRVILGKFAPAAVVITGDFQVLYVRGNTGKYLQPAPGEPSLHLLKMAREGLAHELRNAVHLARKRGAPVRKEGVRVKQNGHTGDVDIEVVPVDLTEGERHFLVVFQDTKRDEKHPVELTLRKPTRKAPGPKGEIARLAEELGATRDYLQSIIQDQEAINEELQSANEEILSSNEELQSTNEELETAKEELQSTNEELNTVNDELQTRNFEVSQINSDLMNLLASVQIPIIMVSNDLRIRRFTPMIERIFNVIPSDVGRPIGDFRPNLSVPNLDQLMMEVIDSVSVRELEVQDLEGRWYSMRIRPYKSIENKIDGAILTLVDIDAVKSNVANDAAADQTISAIVDLVRRPVVVLDRTGRVQSASHAFYRLFRLSPQEVEGRPIYEIHDGVWNVPRLKNLLDDIMTRKDRVENYEITLDHPHLGRKTWVLNAASIGSRGEDSRRVLLGYTSNEEMESNPD
jgi:two-component system, chemotaxis family, CheB/CheR fusion protein